MITLMDLTADLNRPTEAEESATESNNFTNTNEQFTGNDFNKIPEPETTYNKKDYKETGKLFAQSIIAALRFGRDYAFEKFVFDNEQIIGLRKELVKYKKYKDMNPDVISIDELEYWNQVELALNEYDSTNLGASAVNTLGDSFAGLLEYYQNVKPNPFLNVGLTLGAIILPTGLSIFNFKGKVKKPEASVQVDTEPISRDNNVEDAEIEIIPNEEDVQKKKTNNAK